MLRLAFYLGFNLLGLAWLGLGKYNSEVRVRVPPGLGLPRVSVAGISIVGVKARSKLGLLGRLPGAQEQVQAG